MYIYIIYINQEVAVADGQLIMFGDVECTLSAPGGGGGGGGTAGEGGAAPGGNTASLAQRAAAHESDSAPSSPASSRSHVSRDAPADI